MGFVGGLLNFGDKSQLNIKESQLAKYLKE